jgi:BRO family, N-terminal domain
MRLLFGVFEMGSIRSFRSGRSPFDDIMHSEEDGAEWWSGRELMPYLNYVDWRNFENVVRKAKSACRNSGHQVSDHFVEVNEMVNIGSGIQKSRANVQMTRYGCYLVAMNGDPDKAEVAAAQRYFALMTRAAEVEATVIIQEASSPIAKAWSERFRESFLPHVRDVQINHPGCFTVITTLVGQMLYMEDELIRHMLEPSPADRPDVSIGRHWADNRRLSGLAPSEKYADLFLPDTKYEATVAVYPDSERGTFEIWFHQVYLPEKLPNYLGNKMSFSKHGELPPASAADNVCLGLSGKNAKLKPKLRKLLDMAGGFFKAGQPLPKPRNPQLSFFDDPS